MTWQRPNTIYPETDLKTAIEFLPRLRQRLPSLWLSWYRLKTPILVISFVAPKIGVANATVSAALAILAGRQGQVNSAALRP